jgi:hypothetical protein
MSSIRFFTDEDVYGSIAASFRNAGFDAVSTPEAGRVRESDDSQLFWEASNNYAIVTFHVGHFGCCTWPGHSTPTRCATGENSSAIGNQ